MDKELIRYLLVQSREVVASNADWMGWNLFLAIIPLLLSVVLFRRFQPALPIVPAALPARFRSPIWWLGVATFVAFLPNAPYVLTDIIHLIGDIQQGASLWLSAFILIPLYLVFILSGFLAYVVSLINVGFFLHRVGWGHAIVAIELILHLLSAIGVYLGRFLRFNSWNIVTHPHVLARTVVDDLLDKPPLVAIGFSFVVLCLLYYPTKQIVLAVAAYRPQRQLQTMRYD